MLGKFHGDGEPNRWQATQVRFRFHWKNLIQKLRIFMRKITRYKTEITMVMVAIFSEIDNFYKKSTRI